MHGEHTACAAAAGVSISAHEREVLFHLAQVSLTDAISDLEATLSGNPGEARKARHAAEGWARLLDDLGWDEQPARGATLTDVARYRPLLAREAAKAKEELAYLNVCHARGTYAHSPQEDADIANEDLDQIFVVRCLIDRIGDL